MAYRRRYKSRFTSYRPRSRSRFSRYRYRPRFRSRGGLRRKFYRSGYMY